MQGSSGRESNAYRMGPCVHANFMTTHVLLDEHGWTFENTRPYDEESSTNVFLIEVIEEFPRDEADQCIVIYI